MVSQQITSVQTKTIPVAGMHCASCAYVISDTLSKLAGVTSCAVNYATEKATITYDPSTVSLDQMSSAIAEYGYSLTLTPAKAQQTAIDTQEQHVFFSFPLALFVFALMMWDILPTVIPSLPAQPIPPRVLNMGLWCIATYFVLGIGRPFIQGMLRFVRHRKANMDTLVGIGTMTAYLYSTLLLLYHLSPYASDTFHAYFDIVIVVIGFVTYGKYLERKSKAKTSEAIEKLMRMQAKVALRVTGDRMEEIPITAIKPNDVLFVRSGTQVPTDGVIVEGNTSLDTSFITGEPLPQEKTVGDRVIGSTLNVQGSFTMRATSVGSDTLVAHIIQMVEQAQGSKAPVQKLADQIAAVFTPVVLVISVGSFALWVLVGSLYLPLTTAAAYGLLAFVGVLVIACPCALGLATPTALVVGIGMGAQRGILIKDAQHLQQLEQVDTVVFDKTGTLTKGTPSVVSVISVSDVFTAHDVVRYAASLEAHSNHPIAHAIRTYATSQNITLQTVTDYAETAGIGLNGTIESKQVAVHRPSANVPEQYPDMRPAYDSGHTVIAISVDKQVIGFIAVGDTVKPQAKEVIATLNRMHITPILLTGDTQEAAHAIAQQVGITTVYAEVLPTEKANYIKNLQQQGAIVAMVGDGINDAPSLSQAQVGIAMATGSDIAIESAGVSLLGGNIERIPQAIRLARHTMRTIRQNLFWAFIYNVLAIPIAAGVLYPVLGILLNPVIAGIAMAGSSVSVVTNSLLLKRKQV